MDAVKDLIAFIEARLTADEAAAKAASPGPWRVDDETYAEVIYAADDTSVVAGGRWGGEASVFDDTADALHIVQHDPARVLREVEAKRQLVNWCVRMDPPHGLGGVLAGEARRILRWLGTIWSEHPDYRGEWKP